MFTMGFVAPLRLPDKHPSELYIAGSYSRINSRYPLLERASERERENNPGWSKWRGKTGELSCRENAREEKGWGIERSILTKNSFTDSLFARLGVDRANEKRNGVSS